MEAVKELRAGRELNILMAERVMDLPPEKWRSVCWVEGHSFDGYEYDKDYGESGWCYTCGHVVRESEKAPPDYSGNIAAAWLVVDKLPYFVLRRLGDDLWQCQGASCGSGLDHSTKSCGCVFADASTAPLAICLAALEAIGVE